MQKNWQMRERDPVLNAQLARELGIHPIVAQVLINRGMSTAAAAHEFLHAELSDLHDPFLFKDMDRFVKRIHQARDRSEKVLIFGDYDVDGVTSSTLLNKAFTKLGVEVVHHIPHRMDEGYGLNHGIVEIAKKQSVDLLVTVDCGISAVEEVKALKAAGIDVMIIDHHLPDAELPPADAIVNPKQKDCKYPFKDLASVGLAFKITQALAGAPDQSVLDLAAIGTIADIVPLRGENRILVKCGLPRICQTTNLGLRALLEKSNVIGKEIRPYHIGFILGPRINAAGRMESAHTSLNLFLSTESEEAYEIANELEKFNSDRQKMQRNVVQEAFDLIEAEEASRKDDKIIVVHKDDWHKGVLGIVASRIADKYSRPAIVISVKDGVGTASARSISGFHLHNALSNCSDCLENFGGHAGAAGLTIKQENIDPFRDLINSFAEINLEAESMDPTILMEGEIPLSAITLNFAEILASMEPFGEGNAIPLFCSTRLQVRSHGQVLGKDTLKFWVSDGATSLSAVGFGMAKFKDLVKPGNELDLAYEVSIDAWNKAPVPQLKLKDIRLS